MIFIMKKRNNGASVVRTPFALYGDSPVICRILRFVCKLLLHVIHIFHGSGLDS